MRRQTRRLGQQRHKNALEKREEGSFVELVTANKQRPVGLPGRAKSSSIKVVEKIIRLLFNFVTLDH